METLVLCSIDTQFRLSTDYKQKSKVGNFLLNFLFYTRARKESQALFNCESFVHMLTCNYHDLTK